ncbi:MAG: T9SS type A sorting domain-containing protein [Chitinophagales bacterium]|nr:T9SS type A sorting domain-containing protein [Chitinophagales bacterium]
MKHIFTLLAFFTVFTCFGQFTHNPDPSAIIAPVDSLITKYQIDISVDADTTYVVHWELFKDGESWKDGWGTQVCDLNLCYLENVDRNPRSFPNDMGRGTYAWFVYFVPNEIEGATTLELVLYGDADHDEELYRIPIDVQAVKTTSVAHVSLGKDIAVYPNPAQNYFSLTNSNKVEKIKIYNMLGNEVKSFYHYNNAQHMIGDIKPGMYLISMFDKDNNIIKTSKLNKVSTGA